MARKLLKYFVKNRYKNQLLEKLFVDIHMIVGGDTDIGLRGIFKVRKIPISVNPDLSVSEGPDSVVFKISPAFPLAKSGVN
jgi:hypothetical protein